MDMTHLLSLFVLPLVLALIATLLVIAGRAPALSFLAALEAAALYGYMDWGFITSGRSCAGILLNIIGVILLLTGVLLQSIATPGREAAIRNERREAAIANRGRKMESKVYFEHSGPVESSEIFEIDLVNKLAASNEAIEEREVQSKSEPGSWSTDEEMIDLLKKEIRKARD